MPWLSLTPLAATGAAACALGLGVHRHGRLPLSLRWLLVVALAGSETFVLFWPVVTHTWTAANTLPFQLSDVGTVVAIVALLRPQPSSSELTYFWGLSAGLLGLSFPAIGAGFPSPLYFAFYVDHGTLLTVGILLGVVGNLKLNWRSVLKSWTATMALAAVAGLVNLITGGDYMFLRQPPETWSPLMVMGGWPWYVLTAWAICPLLFRLLALPVWKGRSSPGPGRVTHFAE